MKYNLINVLRRDIKYITSTRPSHQIVRDDNNVHGLLDTPAVLHPPTVVGRGGRWWRSPFYSTSLYLLFTHELRLLKFSVPLTHRSTCRTIGDQKPHTRCPIPAVLSEQQQQKTQSLSEILGWLNSAIDGGAILNMMAGYQSKCGYLVTAVAEPVRIAVACSNFVVNGHDSGDLPALLCYAICLPPEQRKHL